MTENRCIEVLKKMKHMFTETCAKIDENTALDMAVEAIKEIQQYRAIGLTPELIEAMQGHNIAMINDLGEYQSIGTIEEFKALKEKSEPKKAKWIFDDFTAMFGNPYHCSNCDEEFGDTYYYCPNCGCNMYD